MIDKIIATSVYKAKVGGGEKKEKKKRRKRNRRGDGKGENGGTPAPLPLLHPHVSPLNVVTARAFSRAIKYVLPPRGKNERRNIYVHFVNCDCASLRENEGKFLISIPAVVYVHSFYSYTFQSFYSQRNFFYVIIMGR